MSAREIPRNGELITPLGRGSLAEKARPVPLLPGDFVMATISPNADSGFRIAEVPASALPAVAGSHVAVLRPRAIMAASERSFFLAYMRSGLARRMLGLTGALNSGPIPVTALVELPVPVADEQLLAAFEELADSADRTMAWHDDAQEVLTGLFENPSVNSARSDVLERGRLVRMRTAAAAALEDFGQKVRTRYPYPIAYRWRSVEAHLSGTDHARTYGALLDTYEVLLCYLAQFAIVMCRSAGAELGALEPVQRKLASGRSGPSLGDWVAILEEVAERRDFRELPASTPLSEVRGFLVPEPHIRAARQRMSDMRNDQAHLRPIPETEIQQAIESASRDLELLLDRAAFLVDLQLVHVAGSTWNSLTAQATISLRYLVGDHPVVPFRYETTPRNDLEVGSLYVMDSNHDLHLLRPFLLGSECPTCHTWSTFHVDGCPDSAVTLKSLEHGHTTTEGEELRAALATVGLL